MIKISKINKKILIIGLLSLIIITGASIYFIQQTITRKYTDPTLGGINDTRPEPGIKELKAPQVTLIGDPSIELTLGAKYADPGAKAWDGQGNDITSSIVIIGDIDVNKTGIYTITYKVTDSLGSSSQITRTINILANGIIPMPTTRNEFSGGSDQVARSSINDINTPVNDNAATSAEYNEPSNSSSKLTPSPIADHSPIIGTIDNTPPVITLAGSSPETIHIYNYDYSVSYHNPGAAAWDNVDGNISYYITYSNNVNVLEIGTYYAIYSIVDSSGNKSQVIRTVNVVSDTTNNPIISLIGNGTTSIPLGAVYTDPGATARSANGDDLTSFITTSGDVDTNTAGTYMINYDVVDSSGAKADRITRVISVYRPITLALNDDNPYIVTLNSEGRAFFNDPGATVSGGNSNLNLLTFADQLGALFKGVRTPGMDITAIGNNRYQFASDVGTYYAYYMGRYGTSIYGDPIYRTIKVIDATPPNITLNGDNPLTVYTNDLDNRSWCRYVGTSHGTDDICNVNEYLSKNVIYYDGITYRSDHNGATLAIIGNNI
ncbi:MAG: DUF5011 domain-containing protein, partial [Candidatus Saccharibacteria bacterium]